MFYYILLQRIYLLRLNSHVAGNHINHLARKFLLVEQALYPLRAGRAYELCQVAC